jgi:uncharacterized protein (TIGR03437 family)
MRGMFLLLFFVVPAFCQFSTLTATDDGSRLYFSSTLQLTGTTDENNYEKIFVYDGTDFHLVAQTSKTDGSATNYYHLIAAYVSGDGSSFGWVAQADCFSIGCNVAPKPSKTVIQSAGGGEPAILPNECVVSRNTQFALCKTAGGPPEYQFSILDRLSGQSTAPVTSFCTSRAQSISSNGRAIVQPSLSAGPGVRLLTLSGSAQLPDLIQGCPIISDDGSTVAGGRDSLAVYHVDSGAASTILSGAQALSISNNGQLILTLRSQAPGTLGIVRADGSGFRTLVTDPTGVNGILSGDGNTVVAETGDGKLLKIDVVSGAVTVLTGRNPVINSVIPVVAGSLSTMSGSGLNSVIATASTVPLPTSLGEVQVLVNGVAAPIFSAEPGSVLFQMPWETTAGDVTIDVPSDPGPFSHARKIQVTAQQPSVMAMYNQDYKILGSPQSLASPGDVIVVYLTGLGPTILSVPDGTVSPSDPLPLLTMPPTASWSLGNASSPSPATVYYAGLAPGLIGVYQVNIQSPSTLPVQARGVEPPSLNLILQFASTQIVQGIFFTPNP